MKKEKERFKDNGNGTVIDNRTGLMWVKNGISEGCNNGCALTWEDAVSFCENLSYAGYTDWRLPNIQELQSIVNYGVCYPAINSTYFPNTQSDYYWSSTTSVNYPDSAWSVYFYSGGVANYNKTDGFDVRPVRGKFVFDI